MIMTEHALKQAQIGPIVPCWTVRGGRCACDSPHKHFDGTADTHQGKHPIGHLVPNGVRDASDDPATIEQWWGTYPDSNIGLRCDRLLVVDIDGSAGTDEFVILERSLGRLPDTPRVCTGNGEHIYFAMPECGPDLLRGTLGQHIDVIRGPGSYVMAPPSTHYSGRRYVWIRSADDVPLAELPLRWLQALQRERAPVRPLVPRDGPFPDKLPTRVSLILKAYLKLQNLWNGQGKTYGDTSASGYDFAFAVELLAHNVKPADVIVAVRMRPDAHRTDLAYARATTEAARKKRSKS